MQFHALQPTHKRPAKKRRGRGGKRGTYSGRGMKGQKARAGQRPAPVVRELLKRYPKLKGYRRVKRMRKPYSVSLEAIAKAFLKDETVSPATLVKKGFVHELKRKAPRVKIVGTAKLKHQLSFEGCTFSEGARKAIEKAGGNIT